jgi:membrane fusion protein (multidrug efflux system)
MKRVTIATAILVLLAVICAGLVWFNFFRDRMISQFFANMPVQTITVSDIEVAPQRWTPGIEAVGTVSASEGVDVSVQTAGVVKSVNFAANDRVAAGDLLVQISDSVERAGVAAATSNVAIAQEALNRAKTLVDRRVATVADLQAAQNRLDQARGGLDQINATIEQKAVKAPFSGTIGIPRIDVGQYIQPGTVIATLQNLETMKVDFTVPEQQLASLSIGQAATFALAGDKPAFTGRITGIDPKIDPNSRLISVQAMIDDAHGALRPGQFIHVRVSLPEETGVIALPQTAVTLSLYGSYVYQVVEAPAKPAADAAQATAPAPAAEAEAKEPGLVARQVFVETGRRSGEQIEILKGVEPGMRIVTSGQNKLSNGSVIRIDNSVDVSAGTVAGE